MANERSDGRRRWIWVAGCLIALLPMAGCDVINKEFRAAAVPAIESGVNAILDGLADGIFAVLDPNATTGE